MNYKNPPVVETVLSVQFNPLPNFGAGQLGAYWKELGAEWPNVTEAPGVEPEYERFERAPVWEQAAILRFSSKVDVRLQIRNKARDRMIQVQNGRFFYNWLKTSGVEYPSYESVRPEFDEHWDRFREFSLSHLQESALQLNQWEIIYVNHIARGTVWKELSDLPNVFTFLRQPVLEGVGISADGLGGEWRYEIEPKKARLYVRIGMTVRKDDEVPCVVLTLASRGPVGNGTSLNEGLRLGHDTITKAFDSFTTAEAKEIWGVQDALK